MSTYISVALVLFPWIDRDRGGIQSRSRANVLLELMFASSSTPSSSYCKSGCACLTAPDSRVIFFFPASRRFSKNGTRALQSRCQYFIFTARFEPERFTPHSSCSFCAAEHRFCRFSFLNFFIHEGYIYFIKNQRIRRVSAPRNFLIIRKSISKLRKSYLH